MAKTDRPAEWLGAWDRDSIGLVYKKTLSFSSPLFSKFSVVFLKGPRHDRTDMVSVVRGHQNTS